MENRARTALLTCGISFLLGACALPPPALPGGTEVFGASGSLISARYANYRSRLSGGRIEEAKSGSIQVMPTMALGDHHQLGFALASSGLTTTGYLVLMQNFGRFGLNAYGGAGLFAGPGVGLEANLKLPMIELGGGLTGQSFAYSGGGYGYAPGPIMFTEMARMTYGCVRIYRGKLQLESRLGFLPDHPGSMHWSISVGGWGAKPKD